MHFLVQCPMNQTKFHANIVLDTFNFEKIFKKINKKVVFF